ncbi:unnamed protein product [marine sediment metagenome]|uniref:Uncharacterized protein n=1 Tax=marine sediment metagenome TaxID=412755 RepID=X1VQL1_9ZZZZ
MKNLTQLKIPSVTSLSCAKPSALGVDSILNIYITYIIMLTSEIEAPRVKKNKCIP